MKVIWYVTLAISIANEYWIQEIAHCHQEDVIKELTCKQSCVQSYLHDHIPDCLDSGIEVALNKTVKLFICVSVCCLIRQCSFPLYVNNSFHIYQKVLSALPKLDF